MTDDPVLIRTDPPPQPPQEELPPKRSRRRIIVTGLLVVAIGLVLVTSYLPRWLTRPGAPADGDRTEAPVTDARRIQATLYYLSESGTHLVETSRSVLYGDSSAVQVRRLVDAQIAAPPEGLDNPIPAGTTVRATFVTSNQEAFVDLGGTFATGIRGSLDEALAVYAIVNTLTVNLPDITAVQILVDGQEVDSLAGHLDLRAPLTKSLVWVEGHERTATTDDTH